MSDAVLFIGGAGDSHSRIMHRLHQRMQLPALVERHYFCWDHGARIAQRIAQRKAAERLVVIGHSWGAVTALRQGLASPGSIDLLITLDPVSWRQPRCLDGISPARRWLNVYVPARQCLRNRNNLIAWLGRHWGPVRYADENHCVSSADHACASAMLSRVRRQLLQQLSAY